MNANVRRVDHISPYTNKQWDAFTFGGQTAGKSDVADTALGRAEILDRAKKLISKDRHDDYGSAEENHERIAAFWRVILGEPAIEPWQVALCMAAVKMARLAFDPSKPDSWVDLAGYAALGGEMVAR